MGYSFPSFLILGNSVAVVIQFLKSFPLLGSSFLPWWPEKTPRTKAVWHQVFRLVLWCRVHSVSENSVYWGKNVNPKALGWRVLEMSVKSISLQCSLTPIVYFCLDIYRWKMGVGIPSISCVWSTNGPLEPRAVALYTGYSKIGFSVYFI